VEGGEEVNMKRPIDMVLDQLTWVPLVNGPDPDSTLPYATHEGVLDIMGHKLRCYQLNTGKRVFAEKDFLAFFGINGEEEG